MTAQAECPVCGQALTVRTDEKLPVHWWSDLEQRHREAPCEGSRMGTRYWPETNGIRHQRDQRT